MLIMFIDPNESKMLNQIWIKTHLNIHSIIFILIICFHIFHECFLLIWFLRKRLILSRWVKCFTIVLPLLGSWFVHHIVCYKKRFVLFGHLNGSLLDFVCIDRGLHGIFLNLNCTIHSGKMCVGLIFLSSLFDSFLFI